MTNPAGRCDHEGGTWRNGGYQIQTSFSCRKEPSGKSRYMGPMDYKVRIFETRMDVIERG